MTRPAARTAVRRPSWPLRVGLLLAFMLVSVGGIVYVAQVSSGRTAPGPQPSAFPGTNPGDGDSAAGGQGQPVDGIKCESNEQLAFHLHAHLTILKDGVLQPVSAYVGIPGYPLSRCIYWLHTHDRTGVIHMEAPAPQTFTLGQFFDLWGQPLTATRVVKLTVPEGQLAVFVDGQPYTGNPRDIVLKAHTQVVIQIGKQETAPTFDFPAGE